MTWLKVNYIDPGPVSLVHTPNINTDTAINIDKLMLRMEIHILPVTINAQCTPKWIITFKQWLIKESAVLDLTSQQIVHNVLHVIVFRFIFYPRLDYQPGKAANYPQDPWVLRGCLWGNSKFVW